MDLSTHPHLDTNTVFVGLDLHMDNVVLCAVKNALNSQGQLKGKVISRGTYKTLGPEKQEELEKVLEELLNANPHFVVVESTYNWYWLADMFERRGWQMTIIDPSTVSENKLKVSNDMTDAHYLAERLRLGSARLAPIQPREARAERDLIRKRSSLVEARGKVKVTLTNFYNNQLGIRVKGSYFDHIIEGNLEAGIPIDLHMEIPDFDHPLIRFKCAALLMELHAYNQIIEQIELEIEKFAGVGQYSQLLKSIKGCGDVLSAVIAHEIHDINRFESAGNFVSYCRLAPTAKLSNGKSKGLGNAKNGNAYLSWALTELANFVCRYNPEAKRCYDRMFQKSRLRVKAIRSLAAKLARAIYMMLKHGKPFELQRCFG